MSTDQMKNNRRRKERNATRQGKRGKDSQRNDVQRSGKRRKSVPKKLLGRFLLAGILLVILVGAGTFLYLHFRKIEPITSAAEQFPEEPITEDYLTINSYSRPGIELDEVDKIVVHYTANPGTDAKANRDYFESLATTQTTYASSHFVISLDGSVIQCIPLNEMAYASNQLNDCCISIECCHPDESGEFSTATYNECVSLVARLCKYYHLNPEEDVLRHYDVTGKECPKYYVDNPEEWDMFIGYVEEYMKK